MKWPLILLLTACGRIGFEPVGGARDGAVVSDGARADGAADDAPRGVCQQATEVSCFTTSTTLTVTSNGNAGNNTTMFADAKQGQCGGAGYGEFGAEFRVIDPGLYEFEVVAAFDTVLYSYNDSSCTLEGDCIDVAGSGGELMQLTLAAGDRIVMVIDGVDGCGNVTLLYRRV